MTLDHRTARATGTGQFDLIRGALPCQPRRGQNGRGRLGIGSRVRRFDVFGHTHAEHAPLVEGLANLGVIEAPITADGMHGELARRGHAINGDLRPSDQRLHRAGVIRIARREVGGKAEPDRRL
jgi:hypothetical protein